MKSYVSIESDSKNYNNETDSKVNYFKFLQRKEKLFCTILPMFMIV